MTALIQVKSGTYLSHANGITLIPGRQAETKLVFDRSQGFRTPQQQVAEIAGFRAVTPGSPFFRDPVRATTLC